MDRGRPGRVWADETPAVRLSTVTPTAPVIVVHSLAHAVAALSAAAEMARLIVIASAPDAGIYAGPGWFGALIAAAREAMPAARAAALLDCGDDAGAAQAAIRAGIEGIVFTGRADVAARLADIAGQRGASFLTRRPEPALDLGVLFFADAETLRRRCADVLASVT
jgi:predicted amidohydrolase YtcJ